MMARRLDLSAEGRGGHDQAMPHPACARFPWRSLACSALAFLVLGSVGAVTAAAEEASLPAAKPEKIDPDYLNRKWTTTDLTALAAALAGWRQSHGDWPSDCPHAAAAALRPSPEKDQWGTPFTCRLDVPAVVSAGPDKTVGTADDLVYRLDGKGFVPPAAGAGAIPTTAAPTGTEEIPAAPATDEARTTTDRLVWMARALESYRKREGHYPVADQAEYLERWLVPTDLPPSQWFATDAWGEPWRYRVTDVGSSYTLSSGGADRRWESLVPATPQATVNADGDLAVADGRFVRWPTGYRPESIASGGGARATAVPEEKEPADKGQATQFRLDRLAAAIERQRKATGAYPESDDAERTFEEIGHGLSVVDAWGHDIEYLTLGGGRHFALVSRGPDGKAGRSTEDYAAGAAAVGDDIVVRK
jgi:hypothetical protein